MVSIFDLRVLAAMATVQTTPSKEAIPRLIGSRCSRPSSILATLLNGSAADASEEQSMNRSPLNNPFSSAPSGVSDDIAVTSRYGGRYGEGSEAGQKSPHLALVSHAGGGTRTPDTRIMIPLL